MEVTSRYYATLRAPVYENFFEARVDEICDERTIVATNRFDSFAIHFVVFFGTSEGETGVAFLANQKIGKVNLRRELIISKN